jgi:hypothetical protein
MKLPAGIEKWGSGVLGLVSLLLVANLVGQYRSLQPGKATAHAGAASAPRDQQGKGAPRAAGDLVRYDPSIHLDALKELDSRPLPDERRNPFDFVGGAPPPLLSRKGAPLPPPAPPPPPPIPLKAVGYNEMPGGKKEAIVTYNDDVQMVHEGDVIASRFKVLKINPTLLVVEDATTHQTLELPFPQ